MARPGVYVSEAPLPRVVTRSDPSQSYGAFIGTAQRGPVTPTRISSWSDFTATFGGMGSGATLPIALYQYFANGGTAAYVARVLYSNAVAATGQFGDGEATKPDRLTFAAVTKGAWGNGLYIDIALTGGGSTFTLTVSDTVRGSKVVVERFPELSMDPAAPRYVTSIVNSQTIGSAFVAATDVTDTTRTGDPLLKGTAATPVHLSGGNDGQEVAAPDPNPVTLDYATAFDYFDEVDGLLVVNLCGETASVASVAQKVAKRGDSVLVVDPPENAAVDDVIGVSPANGSTEGSYSAVYYPWLWIADPSPDAPRGGILKVPPGASVAGMILRMDTSRGMFRAPAGTAARINGAVANEFRLVNTDLDTLADANINVIRPVAGAGVTVMGARTRAYDTSKYLSVRRTLNYVKRQAALTSRFALFQPNTPNLWDQLRVANGAWLSELWQQGGLAGTDPTQAYYVKCDGDINTPTTMLNGEVHIEIGVSPTFPSEFVIIRVGQFEADASVVVTEGV